MNAEIRLLTILLAVAVTFSLFLERSTSAQSVKNFLAVRGNTSQVSTPSANSNCKKIRGESIGTFNPVTGTVSGPVTNSGLLDGSLEDVINFGAGFLFTPDPTVLAYTTDLTISTIQGQLRANMVTTQSVVTATGAEWGQVNPNTSTGKFAGATGLISIVFKPAGDPSVGPFEANITADICFAQ